MSLFSKKAAKTETKGSKEPIEKKLNLVHSPNDIKLGMTIKCLQSGLEGTASTKRWTLDGSVTFAIQPVSESGNVLHDSIYVDYHSIAIVDNHLSGRAEPEDPTCKVQLGDRVRDVISGFEGVAFEKMMFLNGCVYFMIRNEELNKDGKMTETFLNHKSLEIIGEHEVVKEIIAKKSTPKKSDSDRPVGGPMSKAQRV